MNLTDIANAAVDAVKKVVLSGGNIGEVVAQTGGAEGSRIVGAPPASGGQSSLALDPSTVDTIGQEATHPGNTLNAVSNSITSVTDFLKLLAWVFHPLNWLRMVEFVTGLFLFSMGIRPYLDRRGFVGATGLGVRRTVRRTLSATPAGRSMRVTQGRRMGTREGQREAARMQARQQVTRSQREASARERVTINRQARQ